MDEWTLFYLLNQIFAKIMFFFQKILKFNMMTHQKKNPILQFYSKKSKRRSKIRKYSTKNQNQNHYRQRNVHERNES